jgi:hypothetical protein
MRPAEQYRGLADDCDARARQESRSQFRQEWETLARSYRRLAEQADRNSFNDLVYEPPSPWTRGDHDPDDSPAA